MARERKSLLIKGNETFCFDLPEDCIAKVLSLTTPKDACQLSAVAMDYRVAAQSDDVWERFLPSDYQQIIARSVDRSDLLMMRFNSKKEMYMYLCNTLIRIDGGIKVFWLEKWSGKKCFMVSAKDVLTIGGADQVANHWEWIPLLESRFGEAAKVGLEWLLLILSRKNNINISLLSPNTNYAAYLVYSPQSMLHGFFQNYISIVGLSVQIGKQTTIRFHPPGEIPEGLPHPPVSSGDKYPKKRDDGWIEVGLGEFFVNGSEDGELKMNVSNIDMHQKGGFIFEGIEIRPA